MRGDGISKESAAGGRRLGGSPSAATSSVARSGGPAGSARLGSIVGKGKETRNVKELRLLGKRELEPGPAYGKHGHLLCFMAEA